MLMFIINGLVVLCFPLTIYLLHCYLKENGRKFAWWKWALSIVWMFYMDVTVAFIGTAIGEKEPGAALRGGGAFLALGAATGIVLFRFIILNRAGKEKEQAVLENAKN